MEGDSFVGQQAAGIRWLHVHPDYLDGDCFEVIRLARNWRDGALPEAGGVQDQAAMTAASIEVVLVTWRKLQDARDAELREARK
ncbi:hypothetical protein [Croceicoccus gelatinilyticus]|uniref:hypothetical protein n=1 Tax=Croceicoccus gelatinilyticus TaxID=2835536 RepID=UPI001BCAEA4B|nr:hypothetical protein [Croceicoccus gelatinilyticus]MBS7669333.1 hypothetical protein [Croceicoccus gelatinilyticus]